MHCKLLIIQTFSFIYVISIGMHVHKAAFRQRSARDVQRFSQAQV